MPGSNEVPKGSPKNSRRGSRSPSILFATSNRGKMDEAIQILRPFGISLRQYGGKGAEIQADTTSEVAAFSSREAARRAGRAVLVEDAGFFVDSLNGFPGVYSAYVWKTLGVRGVLALLGGSPRGGERARRRARFISSVAYCEPGGEPSVFDGSVRGTVASQPRGSRGFGFDPIFIPDGMDLTFGELSLEQKCAVSHRAEALTKFAEWHGTKSRR
jgi:XTP/dITP diphosphohydrolase